MSWFEKNKIQAVLFDFDDVFIDTHSVFNTYVGKFFSYVNKTFPEITLEQFTNDFEAFLEEAHNKYGVNPYNLWDYSLGNLERKYQKGLIEKGKEIIFELYKCPPQLYPGAKETLADLKQLNIRLGLVTHALPDWTDFKLEVHGLRDFFEHIECVDVNKHKSSEDWLKVAGMFKLSPENVMAVGDSVTGDVIASRNAGIEKNVLIRNGVDGFGWKVYMKGDLPDNVMIVNGIGKLLDTLKD